MANRIKGITIEINGETTGLDKALKSVNSTIRTTQSELRDVTKLLKLDPSNTELVKQKQELLAKAISETKTKLDTLKKAAQQMGEITENSTDEEIQQYNALQREISETESKLKTLTTQQKTFAAQHSTLGEISTKFKSVGSSIEAVGQKLTAVSAAAAAVVTALAGVTIKAAAAADDLNTLSKKTGISTDELQKFQYASELIDVSLEDISKGLARTTKAMGSNSSVLSELNIQTKNANGTYRDTEDVFFDVIDALNKMEDETQRDIYAQELFGKSFQNLNPLIEDGTEALKELYEMADSSDLILSQEEIDKANELNDSIDKLKSTWTLAINKIGSSLSTDLIPLIDDLSGKLESLANWAGEHSGAVTTVGIIAAITAALAPVLIVVGKVITAVGKIAGAISKAWTVISPLMSGIGATISGIWQEIQLVVWGAGEALAGTATTVAGAFGLIAAAVAVAATIIGTIILIIYELATNFDKVKESFEQFKQGWSDVWNQCKQAVQDFIDDVKPILAALGFDVGETVDATAARAEERSAKMADNVAASGTNAINGMASGMSAGKGNVIAEANSTASGVESSLSAPSGSSYSWGQDIMSGMSAGIASAKSWVIEQAESVAAKINALLHFSRPDEGPLRDYEKWMPDFMKGLAKGINSNIGLIDSAMQKTANAMANPIKKSVTIDANSNINTTVSNALESMLDKLGEVNTNIVLNNDDRTDQNINLRIDLGGTKVAEQIFKLSQKGKLMLQG